MNPDSLASAITARLARFVMVGLVLVGCDASSNDEPAASAIVESVAGDDPLRAEPTDSVPFESIDGLLPGNGGCGFLLARRAADDSVALSVEVRESAATGAIGAQAPIELDSSEWTAVLERGQFLSGVVCDDQFVVGEERVVSGSWMVEGTLTLDPVPSDFEPCQYSAFSATLENASYVADDASVKQLGDISMSSILWGCLDFGG